MTKDCTQPLRIGNIRALNGCAGRLNFKCVFYLKEQLKWKEIEKIWKITMQIDILLKILPIPPIIYSLI